MRHVLIGLLLLTTAGCAPGQVGDDNGDGEAQGELRRFVDANLERPEVGELKIKTADPDRVTVCTGTLIGSRTVLSAGHCFGTSAVSDVELGGFYVQPASGAARQRIGFHRVEVGGALDFDLAVVQLDAAVDATLAEPADVDTRDAADSDTMTVYGYGSSGSSCSQDIDDHKRKWTTEAPGLHRWESCPGDSGGPYFSDRTGKIILLVKGNFLTEIYSRPVGHRAWIEAQRALSEAGQLGEQ